mmetsp:Transcript_32113/g.46288  ORF Transcript_32113/g.46288 Transcript_32113/m.46288 type:complete len:154 (+) Transcript_32113:53-514(+)
MNEIRKYMHCILHYRMIVEALSNEDIEKCVPVLIQLESLLNKTNIVLQIKEQMSLGYRLIFIEQDNVVKAALGFRHINCLSRGSVLYIDDIITLQDFRKQGFASTLVYHVREISKSIGCSQILLDCGFQLHDAHRLFLKLGFSLSSHHFIMNV